ncbi:MAG: glycosyltransferase family 1 protein [Phycisphaerales bacterium]|nr:glycosyltransferase family 1 protein [Phycisphaerales bacterium]
MADLSVHDRVGLIAPPATLLGEPALVPHSFDPRTLSANLDALRESNPDLARRMADLTVPSNVEPTIARDGSPTCRRGDAAGRPVFLGRTTMPRIRAVALVEVFAPDGHNVLLPAIGAGYEANELLRRTADHCAVFVHEPDLLDFRLALSLIDLSGWLRRRRLIPLTSDDLATELGAFLDAHPGFEFPHRVLIPPHLDRRRIDPLRADLQQLAARVNHAQADRVRRHAAALAILAAEPRTDHPVVLLSVDPRPGTINAARAIAAAAERIGWHTMTCLPDQPDRCHAAARIQALVEHTAGAALLINCGWGPLLPHIPPILPVATWLLPDARLLPGVTDGFSPRHLVFAATPDTAQQAVACGANPARVRPLDIAIDERTFRPADTASAPQFDVACFADLHSLEPADCGLSLESHLRLWQSVIAAAARQPWAAPESVLSDAERLAGVALSEDHLRQQFDILLRRRVFPTLRARGIVEHLAALGFDIRVFGNGWHQSRVPAERTFTKPSDAAERNAVYNSAQIVVCPSNDPPAGQVGMEAAAAGACVVRYAGGDDEPARPQLLDALQAMNPWRDIPELRAALQSLLADERRRRDRSTAARDIILNRHLWTHRLTAIRRSLAELAVPE